MNKKKLREERIYDYFMGYKKWQIDNIIWMCLTPIENKLLNDYCHNLTEGSESQFKSYLVPKILKGLKNIYGKPNKKVIKKQKKKKLKREWLHYNATHSFYAKRYGSGEDIDLKRAILKYRETHADDDEQLDWVQIKKKEKVKRRS